MVMDITGVVKTTTEKHVKCVEGLTKNASTDTQESVVVHTPNVMLFR